MLAKPVAALTAEDLARHPVWVFDGDAESAPGGDETWVVPIRDLPVADLANRLVAASLRVGGRPVLGLLGNVSLHDARMTREFLTLSVLHDGAWFHLARYHDADFDRRGPAQLAARFDLPVAEVFPIRYDISAAAVGVPEVVRGLILAEPAERLTDAERLDWIIASMDERSAR